jgi:hypothetical protein
LAAILVGSLALGCGGDKDRGKNRNKDRQKAEKKNPERK